MDSVDDFCTDHPFVDRNKTTEDKGYSQHY